MNEEQSRWDAPVVYLKDYPTHDISPRGIPYFVCQHCLSRLEPVPVQSAAGVMFVCIYNCGQRYWVDSED